MFKCVAALILAVLAMPLYADIYECVDESGNKRFTNIKSEAKGCKPMNLGPANVVTTQKPPAKAASKASPADFPKVDPNTQQKRDGDRRKILERELANEETLLAQAQKELAEQEATRLGSERNYQRVVERLEPFKKKVSLHESNIATIRRELAAMK